MVFLSLYILCNFALKFMCDYVFNSGPMFVCPSFCFSILMESKYVCVSVCVSILNYLRLSLFLSVCTCQRYLSLYDSLSVCTFHCLTLSVCLFVCVSISMVSQSLCKLNIFIATLSVSVCPFRWYPILSICPSTRPFQCYASLSIC